MAKTHCKKGGIHAWWQDFCIHFWKPSPVYPLTIWFTSLEHANHMNFFLTLTPSQILITEFAWNSEAHHLNQIQMEMRILGSNSSDAADPETCELKRPITCPLHGHHSVSRMAASDTKVLTLFQSLLRSSLLSFLPLLVTCFNFWKGKTPLASFQCLEAGKGVTCVI